MSGLVPGSPEWLAERRNGIGASEVPAILGVDRYKTGLDIWLEKRGLAERTGDDTGPQRVGRFAEPMIAKLYADTVGVSLRDVPRVRHPDFDMLFASADRMVVGLDDAWLYPVEIKNRGGIPRGWGDAGTDHIPQAVAVQVHVQMACYDLDRADVAALLGGNDFRVYTVHRDPTIERVILERVAEWWQRHMVQGEEPEITGPSADDYLARKFQRAGTEVVRADGAVESLLRDYALARAARVRASELEDALKLQVQAAVGDNRGIEGAAGRALWSNAKGRVTTDWQAMARSLAPPEQVEALVEQFTQVGAESRRFTFTPFNNEDGR